MESIGKNSEAYETSKQPAQQQQRAYQGQAGNSGRYSGPDLKECLVVCLVGQPLEEKKHYN